MITTATFGDVKIYKSLTGLVNTFNKDLTKQQQSNVARLMTMFNSLLSTTKKVKPTTNILFNSFIKKSLYDWINVRITSMHQTGYDKDFVTHLHNFWITKLRIELKNG
jgi:hypothetical protein